MGFPWTLLPPPLPDCHSAMDPYTELGIRLGCTDRCIGRLYEINFGAEPIAHRWPATTAQRQYFHANQIPATKIWPYRKRT